MSNRTQDSKRLKQVGWALYCPNVPTLWFAFGLRIYHTRKEAIADYDPTEGGTYDSDRRAGVVKVVKVFAEL